MRYKLKQILTFLTINPIMKFLFQFDLRFISFFSDNLFGYSFYIFCVVYGFFGCSGDSCTIPHSCAAIFAVFTVSLTIQTYLLVKIPFTRAYLENLLGATYIEKYLGKYTGSEALAKVAKHTLPILALGVTEHFTASSEAARYYKAADSVEKKFTEHHLSIGSQPSIEQHEAMVKQCYNLVEKAANAKGIITRGFAASGLGK